MVCEVPSYGVLSFRNPVNRATLPLTAVIFVYMVEKHKMLFFLFFLSV